MLSVLPAYSLIGPFAANFTVFGSGFGSEANHLQSVRLGGVPCGDIQWVSSHEVRCLQLACDELAMASGRLSQVDLVVQGQTSFPSLAFEAVQDPVISRISPAKAVIGSSVLVLGQNFGYSSDDFGIITIDTVPCTN